MNPEIILIGGGGHCKSVIDVIECENKFKIAGILDIPEKKGTKVFGYSIIATDDEIETLVKKYTYFFITLGQLKNPKLRIKIYTKIKQFGGILPVIISPRAYVSKYSKIDEGTIIMHDAIVNANSYIGKNCIINTKSLIEHDTQIDDFCHISTNATINGNCKVEQECMIGSKSVLKQGVKITSETIIGSGAVVTKNITQAGIYVGTPAKKM